MFVRFKATRPDDQLCWLDTSHYRLFRLTQQNTVICETDDRSRNLTIADPESVRAIVTKFEGAVGGSTLKRRGPHEEAVEA